MNRWYLPFICVLVIGTNLWCVQSFAKSSDKKALKQEIEQERSRLQELNQEIRDTQQKAKKVESEQDSVLKTIENLDKKLKGKQDSYQQTSRQLKKKDRELAELNAQLADIGTTIKQQRHSISARLRLLYMEGRDGYVKALLSANSFSNFERRLAYLSTIAQQEYHLLQKFHTDLNEVEQLKEQQARARDDLLQYKGQTEKTIREMKGVKKEKNVVLTSLSKEKELYDRSVEGLQRSAQQVDGLLKELDQRFKLSKSKKRAPSTRPLSRGSLLWPTDGTVVTFFGRQKHPTFDTYINKKGIEIKTTGGSPIRTVSSGTVVYADWLKGYGLVVIIDHQNGFFSLYAHSSKLLVKEGQPVEMGQTIGETGETGLTQGNTLYFELRKGTKPVDPLRWLVKRP
jgi:septal ring factor EnvC (AmiA/AmiB activator)